MKIVFRFQGAIITTTEVNESTKYTVGRNPESNIQLLHSNVSRQQGELYFEEGEWKFAFHSSAQATPIDSQIFTLRAGEPIHLPSGLEIVTSSDVEQEATQVLDVRKLREELRAGSEQAVAEAPSGKSKVWLGFKKQYVAGAAAAMACLVIVSVVSRQSIFAEKFHGKMDVKTLQKYADSRVVRFSLTMTEKDKAKLMADSKLQASDFKDEVGFCTGFHVGKGYVVTASHCLFGETGLSMLWPFQLKTEDNKSHEIKEIAAMDYALDYVVLNVPSMKDYPAFDWADSREVGQPVYTVGNVEGSGIAIRDGILSSETPDERDPKIKYLRFSAPASPGNSGGPLVSDHGYILGLVSAKNESENYNIGIPAEYIRPSVEAAVKGKPGMTASYDFAKPPSFAQQGNPFGGFGRTTTPLSQVAEGLALPTVPDSWFEQYGLPKTIKNLRVEVTLPRAPEDFYVAMLKDFQKKYMTEIAQIKTAMQAKGVEGWAWTNQVTQDSPVKIPTDDAYSIRIYKNVDGKGAFASAALVNPQSPEEMEEHKKYAGKKANTDQRLEVSEQALYEQKENQPSTKLGYVLSIPKDTMNNDGDISVLYQEKIDFKLRFPKGLPDSSAQKTALNEAVEKVTDGDAGGIQMPYAVFPWVRSRSEKTFKVSNAPAEMQWREFTDKTSRKWMLGVRSFYGVFDQKVSCLSEGYTFHCSTHIFEASPVAELDNLVIENAKDGLFSNRLPIVGSFTPEEILDPKAFAEIKKSPNQQDFSFSVDPKTSILQAKFGALNQSVDLGNSKNIHSIQLVSGMIRENPTSTRWVAVATRVIRDAPKKTVELCTMGYQFNHKTYDDLVSPYSAAMSRAVASVAKKGKKKLAEPAPDVVDITDTFAGMKLQRFSHCENLGNLDKKASLGDEDDLEGDFNL